MMTALPLARQCSCKFAAAKSAARPSVRLAVCCAASGSAEQSRASRRGILASFIAAPLVVSPAFALIPDDDDEELLELAKKNRGERLKAELEIQKQYAKSSGFRDVDQAPLQKAVTSLARAGSQLSAGDVNAAGSTLGGSWLQEAVTAAKEYGDFSGVASAIAATQTAAAGGSLTATKEKFVSAVSAFQSWASTAGIAGQLRGI